MCGTRQEPRRLLAAAVCLGARRLVWLHLLHPWGHKVWAVMALTCPCQQLLCHAGRSPELHCRGLRTGTSSCQHLCSEAGAAPQPPGVSSRVSAPQCPGCCMCRCLCPTLARNHKL